MASESGSTGGKSKKPLTADIIRGYGFDPNVVATPDGKLIDPFEEHQSDQSYVSDDGSFSSAKSSDDGGGEQ